LDLDEGTIMNSSESPARVGPVLRTRALDKRYGHGDGEVRALEGVELEVTRGETLAVMGPSGCGKSTLLHLLGGLDRAEAGVIELAGEPVTGASERALSALRRRRVGFVFQFFHLLPSLTAWENVRVPLEIAGAAEPGRRADALLNEVGLGPRRHHYPSQLSGGEQQRVAIARALANDPAILLADEPTGNLDSGTGHHIIDLLIDVNRHRKTTVVLVTHDPELAARADVTIALRDGHVVS
jgi:putative ABC transport system ATP-binding protein